MVTIRDEMPCEAVDTPRPGEGWGLYVHFPWCLRKCPYCDFNSHTRHESAPIREYLEALAKDLALNLETHGSRPLSTIFIGGGTPNLMSPEQVATLLETIRGMLPCAENLEITLEANPGADDRSRWRAYREAGINRLSLGVQSLDDRMLRVLGRIHDAATARRAYSAAREAGFENINLDLMTGLPGQTIGEALCDLGNLLDLRPDHLSWYELTYEPATPFGRRPPPRLGDDERAEILARGRDLIAERGYVRYEVSAYARPGYWARHNLGYWRFSDYLAIGAGAHAKISHPNDHGPWRVIRESRPRRPRDYLHKVGTGSCVQGESVEGVRLASEFYLNVWRLVEGFHEGDLERVTGQSEQAWHASYARAVDLGLAHLEGRRWRPTSRGLDMLADLQELFLEPLD